VTDTAAFVASCHSLFTKGTFTSQTITTHKPFAYGQCGIFTMIITRRKNSALVEREESVRRFQ
jgi:hypothetical protein